METVEFSDISYCQTGAMDFDNISKVLGALALRSSQDDFIDSQWVEFFNQCQRIGMPYFGWHFVQPNNGPAIQIETIMEAWNMQKRFKPKCIGFDVEDIVYTTNTGVKVNVQPPSKGKATLWLWQLIEGVRRQTGLSKKACVIYTRVNYWEKWIFPSGTNFSVDGISYTAPDWSEYSLWIAAWIRFTGPGAEPFVPKDWEKTGYRMHQYQGGDGEIQYIKGGTDRDRFHGTYQEMITYMGKPDALVEPVIIPFTVPYTASVLPTYLTVKALPDYNSDSVAWLAHGTPVTVTIENNGWAKIEAGWIHLDYVLFDKVYQSLENQVSISVTPTPEPPPVIPPVSDAEKLARLWTVHPELHSW